MSEHPRSALRADIQGLRAIAVVSVVLFHAFRGVLPGGYVGVDVFFVISGYLITGVLLRDIELGRFSLANFYAARVRRILPALTAMLLACLAAGAVILGPVAFRELGITTLSTAVFASNIAFWRLSDYFDGLSELKPLLHTWSLAVEEQFYLLYPVVLFWLRKMPRARLRGLAWIGIVVSLAFCEWLRRLSPVAAFYLAPPRAFELLLGAVVAMSPPMPALGRALREGLATAGLAMILVPLVTYSSATPFPGLAALLPCAGAALLIYVGTSATTAAGRAISVAPFAWIGNLSYSLYLWHWPVLAYFRHVFGFELSATQSTVAVVLALIGAAASYYAIEQPVRASKLRVRSMLRIGVGSIAVSSLLGLGVAAGAGLPQRFDSRAQALFAYSTDFNKKRGECHNSTEPLRAFGRNCVFGDAGTPPDVAVWGDSHGAELVVALGVESARIGRSVMEITSSACPPAQGIVVPGRRWCAAQNSATLRGLIADPHIRAVVLAANAERYANVKELEAGYEQSVRALREAGKTVVLVLQIPTMRIDPPEYAGLNAAWGRPLETVGRSAPDVFSKSAAWNSYLREIAGKYGAKVYDPASNLCDEKICHAYRTDAGVLYFDSDHLGVSGIGALARGIVGEVYGEATQAGGQAVR